MDCYFVFLLHAHLPYVRHPEHEYSLEENWLFEAIRETYIPLLDMLERQVNDGISPRLTLTISPPLTEMLNDELLKKRFLRYLDNLIELSEHEKKRTRSLSFEPMARLYNARFREVRRLYVEEHSMDLVSSFKRLQDEGHVEIAATAATHAFLPAFENYPETVKGQIEIGIRSYTRNFGRKPSGFWLPESGYFKGLDSFLKDAGIKYFFLESHGIIYGRPKPRWSIYKPARSSSGLAVFGRDFKSSQQVWCASSGYPGDPLYRDFYRDIGFDLPSDYISKFTHFHSMRTFTGIKYYSVTDKTENKLPYNMAAAMDRMRKHALHFIGGRERDFKRLSKFMRAPLIFAAFDAELFGHWWFEGVEWLDAVLRAVPDNETFAVIAPADYLGINSEYPADAGGAISLSPSSWGEGGYYSLWIGEKNHGLYRQLHKMPEKMRAVIKSAKRSRAKTKRNNLIRRAANQAMKEMLLAQSSDWAFLIEKDRASEYAANRVAGHIANFNLLFLMIMNNAVDETALKKMEESGKIFEWLDAAGNYEFLPSDSRSS